jgi:hypothetical protein
MHALPTKAPGEATKMHSVMSAFFNVPVTGEEKKKRLQSRIEREWFSFGESLGILTREQKRERTQPRLQIIFFHLSRWWRTSILSLRIWVTVIPCLRVG